MCTNESPASTAYIHLMLQPSKMSDMNISNVPPFLHQARLAMELKTPEEKLGWIFTLFDSDGGGEIEVSIGVYSSHLSWLALSL